MSKREEIDQLFEQILKECPPGLNNVEIMEKFREIIGARMMPAMFYNENTFELYLYRVTTLYPTFNPEERDSYSYPPNPKIGRANLEGHPVFYCSQDPWTAILEMKGRIKNDEKFYISRWRLHFDRNLIAHHLTVTSQTLQDDNRLNSIVIMQEEQLKEIVSNTKEKFDDEYFYRIKKMGDLYTVPSDALYHLTSAYSHDILYTIQENIDVPIIVYPSVENKHEGINWAIHPRLTNSSMELKEVFELSITENKLKETGEMKYRIHRKGICSGDSIIAWSTQYFEVTEINYAKVQVLTHSKEEYSSMEALKLLVNNGTLKDWLDNLVNSTDFHAYLSQQEPSIEQGNLMSHSELHYDQTVYVEFREEIIEIASEKGNSFIYRMSVPMKWRKWYSN